MTRRRGRKSKGSPEDQLAKKLSLESQSEDEPNRSQTPTEDMDVADSVKVSRNERVNKQQAAGDDDDEISFNFKTKRVKKSLQTVMSEATEPGSTGPVEDGGATVAKNELQISNQATGTLKGSRKRGNQLNNADAAAMATIDDSKGTIRVGDSELRAPAMKTNNAEEEVPEEKQLVMKDEESKVKQKSRKRKAPRQTNIHVIQSKKVKKSGDIFFYCGNLPPGITAETLRFFLEEDGIHPRVFLKRMKEKDKSAPKLTPKQKFYKKNQLKAAKLAFATVIVKTEEEAKKMSSLNGIAMPSPSNIDYDTELKIVRQLPRPAHFHHKVHVGNLHPGITEDELTQYLEGHGIKPGQVVIVRNQKTGKSRRHGFVWLKSGPQARKAVELPEPFMRGRPLVIQRSSKKAFKNY